MEEIKLKPEFEEELRKLGRYEKWADKWEKSESVIDFINSLEGFYFYNKTSK